jgi:hypothetical protein
MNNDIPNAKEFKRILKAAETSSSLAETLKSLKNAWMLCDTEYFTTKSELDNIVNELNELEKKLLNLKKRRAVLEDKIFEMDHDHAKTKHPNQKIDINLYKDVLKTIQGYAIEFDEDISIDDDYDDDGFGR